MTFCQYRIGTAATGTGTVTVNSGLSDVTGSGTSFTAFYTAGDYVAVGGIYRVVQSVTTSTQMVITGTWPAAQTGAAHQRIRLTNVESLTTPLDPPKATYQPWAVTYNTGDGLARGAGRPLASWRWGFLTQAQRDQLRTFCTGKSARVYISTRTVDSTDAYDDFQAAMIWPDEEDRVNGRRLDFAVDFRDLVAL